MSYDRLPGGSEGARGDRTQSALLWIANPNLTRRSTLCSYSFSSTGKLRVGPTAKMAVLQSWSRGSSPLHFKARSTFLVCALGNRPHFFGAGPRESEAGTAVAVVVNDGAAIA